MLSTDSQQFLLARKTSGGGGGGGGGGVQLLRPRLTIHNQQEEALSC